VRRCPLQKRVIVYFSEKEEKGAKLSGGWVGNGCRFHAERGNARAPKNKGMFEERGDDGIPRRLGRSVGKVTREEKGALKGCLSVEMTLNYWRCQEKGRGSITTHAHHEEAEEIFSNRSQGQGKEGRKLGKRKSLKKVQKRHCQEKRGGTSSGHP